MNPPEPPLSRIRRLVRLYGEGTYTQLEVADYCISVADNTNALQLLQQLPSEILAEVKRWVQGAPTTEVEWEQCDVFSINHAPQPSSTREKRVAKYRISTEALRAALNALEP